MGRGAIFVTGLALIAGLGGCATTSSDTSAQADSEEVTSSLDSEPRAKAIYHVLVGELAGQRGDNGRAAESYAEAARAIGSAELAERAARVAVYAEREDLAREAAERWRELAPDSSSPRQLLALLALRQGEAEEAYSQLESTFPDDEAKLEQALAETGAFLANEAANDTGVEVASRFADNYDDQRMAHYIEAQVALESGDAETAVAAAERSLERSDGWRAARLIRVRALLAAERIEDAIAALEGLVSDNPENYDLRLQYARTLQDRGRSRSALDQYQRLVEAQPDDSRALYAGALVALERGEYDQARGWLERLLDKEQRTEAAQYYLGRIAEEKGDYAAARDRYSRTGGPYDKQAQLRLAHMEADEGEVGEAIERLERLRENNPDRRGQAWQAQGQLLREAGRLDDAIEAYSKGLDEVPDDTDLRYARAMTQVQRDNIDAAEQDLRAVLEKEPDNAHALNALGYTLANNTDRLEEAAELIRKAYAKLPEDPAVIDSRGWIAYKQGRLEEAERYLHEAYEMSEQAEIAAHYGEVLWKLGKRDEARRVWNEALADHPDAETLKETMERLKP